MGTGRGGGKSFSSFRAFSWPLETFQTTFTLRFVSNFESPNTQLGSPITQLDSSNTEPGAGYGNGEPKLGNGTTMFGNWRVKVGYKTESKSWLESFQQP